MNHDVVITCAVTGSGASQDKHPELPITPQQIADSALDAARAGAAIVHLHVRDPDTGIPSRDPALYRETVDRIRSSGVDVIINTTSGMGGDLVLDEKQPHIPGEGTDLIPALERLVHVEELLPDICTLDCGSMNFGDGSTLMLNSPPQLREMARRAREIGVRPELEVFDTGHFWFAQAIAEEGLLDEPMMLQFCHGIPWGMPADVGILKNMVDKLPGNAFWTSFAISRMQIPWVAQSILLGGNVRVGLEDNIYLSRGVFASNAQLVEKAVNVVAAMGANVVGPDQARQILKLTKRG